MHKRKAPMAMSDKIPTVVIVGGGFAGLSAAKALRNAPVRTILVDRTNHHLFQPLLYQIATSVLSPAQIASPCVKYWPASGIRSWLWAKSPEWTRKRNW